MFNKILYILATSIELLSLILHAEAHHAPSATLDAGVIVGTTATAPGSTVTVKQFLGVPFAAKPTRFGMPEPPSGWWKPLKTIEQAPSCFQQFQYPISNYNLLRKIYDTPPPPAGESEDCLYLDVYVPKTKTENKVVLFYLYGGGTLKYGANSLAELDGTSFAANQDVIIVAPNYRQSVFGFPNSPQLPIIHQNLGYYDQRLALEWVQRNIHAFGGDPAAVTLFGQAAGAASLDNIIATTPINPPFRAAILHSGQVGVFNSNPNGTAAWDSLAKQLNCSTKPDVLKCVQAADATTILSIVEQSALDFTTVKDNVTELTNAEGARKSGDIARVPVLLGTVAQEGRSFEYLQNNLPAFLIASVGNHSVFIEDVEQLYAIGTAANGWVLNDENDQISAIYTDVQYQCSMAIVANDSMHAGIPTWRFLYNATFPDIQPLAGLDVYHGSEVPVVFGNLPPPATAFEKTLSKYLQSTWANFAKCPAAGLPWPQYPTVAVLGNASQLVTLVSPAELDSRCSFWDALL